MGTRTERLAQSREAWPLARALLLSPVLISATVLTVLLAVPAHGNEPAGASVRFVFHASISAGGLRSNRWRAGHSIPVSITLREESGDAVRVDLSIPSGSGALTALFGNVRDENLLPTLRLEDVSGHVTDRQFGANRVRRFRHGNNLLPLTSWDYGIEFGGGSRRSGQRGDPWAWWKRPGRRPVESVSFRLVAPGLTLRELLGAENRGWRLGVRVRGTGPHNRSLKLGLSRDKRPAAVGPAIRIGRPQDGRLLNVTRLLVAGEVSGTRASVEVNGTPASVDGGYFRARVPLVEGGNRIVATARNLLGSATDTVEVVLDTLPPVVSISAPAEGAIVVDPVLAVSGSVHDASQISRLFVNGVSVELVGGTFHAQVQLTPGVNEIVAQAVDTARNLGVSAPVHVILAACLPGAIEPCYEGPAGSEGVGACAAGFRSCLADGSGFGICEGQVLPSPEACNGLDDDCDGSSDDDLGATTCGVGICEHGVDRCSSGAPGVCDPFEGAHEEICTNSLDDDCDGVTDEPEECVDRTPPEVAETSVSDVEGFGICDSVVIRMSEPILEPSDPVQAVQLIGADLEPVPGEVRRSQDGFSLVFDPAEALASSSPHTLRVAEIQDLAGNPLAAPFLASFETLPADSCDGQAPRLIATAPTGIEVPTNSPVTFLFDERMDPSTLGTDSIEVRNLIADVAVPGVVNVDPSGRIAYFLPLEPLSIGRLHWVFATPEVKDIAGNVLLHSSTSHRRSEFTTGFAPGGTAPMLVLASPPDGAVGVPPNGGFVLIFDEPIWSGLEAGVNVLQDGEPVAGSFTKLDGNRIVRFRPAESLTPDAEVEIELTTRIRNLLGAPLANPGTIRVRVGSEPITQLARVLRFNPSELPIGGVRAPAATNVSPSAEFTVPVDPATVSTTTVRLRESASGELVPGRVVLSDDGRQATFHPDVLLEPLSGYSLSVSGVIGAGSGLILSTRGTAFVTESGPDTTRPAVFSSAPPDLGQAPSNSSIGIRVDELVNLLSVEDDAIRVFESGGTRLEGAVVAQASGIRFLPGEPLRAFTEYVVEADGFRDVADNPVLPFTSTFETGGVPDGNVAVALLSEAAVSGVGSQPAHRVIDGDPLTHSCARGDTPYVEVILPGVATVTEVSAVGVRFFGSEVLAGVFDLFGTDGSVLATTGEVLMPPPTPRRVDVEVGGEGGVDGVTRVRFRITQARELPPCLAELQVRGEFEDPAFSQFIDRQRPTLLEVTPASGSHGVDPGASIVATFDEPIDAAGQYAVLLSMWIDSEPRVVPGGFETAGSTLTFVPDQPWPAGRTISYRIAARDLAGNYSFSQSFVFDTLGALLTDEIPPEILLVSPADGAEEVGEHARVHVVFSEPIDPQTIENEIRLFPTPQFMSWVRSIDNTQFSLKRSLLPDTEYALVVTDEVTDLAGNAAATFVSRFRTSRFEEGGPTIVSLRPGGRTSNVAPDLPIVLFADEPLDLESLEAGLFVSENGSLIPGVANLAAGPATITFTPDRPFTPNALVEVFATPRIVDLFGNPLKNLWVSFTIAPDPDSVAAFLEARNPRDSNNPTNSALELRYSEPLDPETVNGETVVLTEDGDPVGGSVDLVDGGRVVRVVPDFPLVARELYAVTATGLVGADGHPVAAGGLGFRTGSGPDVTAPSVVSISPPDGAAGVGVNAKLTIRFDEAMNPVSVGGSTVILADASGEPVRSSLGLVSDDETAILIPQEPLVAGSLYRIVVAGVTDVAGNPVAPAAGAFVTGAGADVSGPRALTRDPTGSDVPINARLEIVFDEPIDPGTVSPEASVLEVFGLPDVSGTVAVSSDWRRISFVPDGLLPVYTTLSWGVGVSDLSGNAAESRLQFSTEFFEDDEPPTFDWVHPPDGSDDVPLNVRVVLGFSEELRRGSLEGISLEVDGVPVPSRSFIEFHYPSEVTVVPELPLRASTQHTLHIDGVQDRAGNLLAAPSVTTFRTETGLESGRVQVQAINPRDRLREVPTNVEISFVLTSWVNPDSVDSRWFVLDSEETGRVAGTARIDEDGLRGRFSPDAPLEAATRYEFSIASGAYLDRAGLRNLGRKIDFTTGSGPDSEPPTVLALSPPPGATGVPANVRVEARLDGALNLLSVGPDALRLFEPGGLPVAGALDVEDDLLVFLPDEPLAAGTDYTVEIGGFRDVADNPILPRSSHFRTTEVPDANLSLAPSSILSASSEAGFSQGLAEGADGDLQTSWCAETGDAANLGREPFLEVSLPAPASVTEVAVVNGFETREAFAGVFDLFAADGSLLVTTGEVELSLPEPRGVSVLVGGADGVAGVTRVRFTVTQDESIAPCLAELKIVGVSTDPGEGSFADLTRPNLVRVTPADGAVDVAGDTAIVLEFDEPIGPASVVDGSLSIHIRGLGSPEGTLSLEGATLTFVPERAWPPLRTVDVTVRTSLKDLAGNRVYGTRLSFTTGVPEHPDVTPPEVVMVTPSHGAMDVALLSPISITFSEPLDPASLRDNVVLFVNGYSVLTDPTRSSDNTVLSLGSAAGESTFYAVAITDGVTDLAGNRLENLLSVFVTSEGSDEVRPRIVSVRPGNGATRVDPDSSIVVYADEALDEDTLADGIFVSQDGALLPSELVLVPGASTLEVVPGAPFSPGANVRLTVKAWTIHDLAGNPLAGFESTFAVAPDPATEWAFVEDWSPGPLSDVPINAELRVRYSEPLDPATINEMSVLLRGHEPVPGTVSLEPDGRTIRFQPQSILEPHTHHVLHGDHHHPGQSADGDFLPADPLQFRTSGEEDLTSPQLIAVSPPDGASGVGVNALLSLRFDEPVSSITVNETSIRLSGPAGDIVPCTFSFRDENRTTLMTPHTPLTPGTQYTVRVSGVTDLAGNRVAAAVSDFVTGGGPDTSAPRSLQVSPAHRALQVPTNAILIIEFDEALDPTWILQDGIRLFPSQLPEVTGTMSLGEEGRTVTFLPDSALAAGTSHSWEIGPIADLSGNGRSGSQSLAFTTGAGPDLEPPRVLATSPTDGAVDVPTNVRVVHVTFDAALSPIGLDGVSLFAAGEEVEATLLLDTQRTLVTLELPRPLDADLPHELRIEGVRDLAGNELPAPLTIGFTTASGIDLESPQVVAFNPPGGSGVPTNVIPRALLDEPLAAVSVNEATVRLRAGTTNVSGRVELASDGRLVTFLPDVPLDPLVVYRLELHSGVRDLIGNRLRQVSRLFETGADADTMPPHVAELEPFDGATQVPTAAHVTVTLDEQPNLTTLDEHAIALFAEGVEPVAGVQIVVGETIEFVPTGPLAADTEYTIVLGGVADVADNPLPELRTTFTTSRD